MEKLERKDLILSLLLLIISAAGFLVWNLNTPIGEDDYNYRTIMLSDDEVSFACCFGPVIETVSDAAISAYHVFLYDHGRWANVLLVLLMPFPAAVTRIISSVLFVLGIFMLSKITYEDKRPAAFNIAVVTLLVWTALPWYDNMYALCYQTNYIWTTAAMLAYIIVLPHALRTQNKTKFGLFLLYCVFLANGHEGFAIITGAFTLGLWPSLTKEERKKTLYIFLALFIGFCLVLYCGIARRLNHVVSAGNYSVSVIKYLISRIASQAWPIFLSYFIFLLRFIFQKRNRAGYFKKSLPCLLAMAAELVIVFVVHSMDRVLWPGTIMAIIFLAINIGDFAAAVPAKAKYAAAAAFAIVYAAWFIPLIRWQKIMTAENNNVYETMLSLRNSPTEVYPGHYTPSSEVPFYLMGIVCNPLDHYFTQNMMATSVKPRLDAKMLLAVDPAMTGPFEEWPEVPGNSGVRGVYPWIAVRDTSFHRIHMVLGPPPANKTPIDKLLIHLKYGPNPGKAEVNLNTGRFHEIYLPDSSVVYRLDHEPLGRTLMGREVLRIDRADD